MPDFRFPHQGHNVSDAIARAEESRRAREREQDERGVAIGGLFPEPPDPAAVLIEENNRAIEDAINGIVVSGGGELILGDSTAMPDDGTGATVATLTFPETVSCHLTLYVKFYHGTKNITNSTIDLSDFASFVTGPTTTENPAASYPANPVNRSVSSMLLNVSGPGTYDVILDASTGTSDKPTADWVLAVVTGGKAS